jgi:hypothetical protein
MNFASSAPSKSSPPKQLKRRIKSGLRQKWEMVQLIARLQIRTEEYHLYGFAAAGTVQQMLRFITRRAIGRDMWPRLNDPQWRPLLENKWLAHLHYQHFGIRVPEVYGIYDPGAGLALNGRPFSTPGDLRAWFEAVRPTNLVIKPVGGIQGKGVLILADIRYESAGLRAITNTGETLSFDDLAAYVEGLPGVHFGAQSQRAQYSGYLLQARVRQHEFLSAMAPTTTNTFRIVTLLTRDGEVSVHAAALRLGRKGTMADNWDRGGISVAVDVETGMLGDGLLKLKYGGARLDTHPDTGARFHGLQVPLWPEILDMAVRAAKVTPRLRSVGWDVALTPDGPVLIEGNPKWGLPMVQAHTEGLLRPEVRRQLAEFGITFPEHELPPVSWEGVMEVLRQARNWLPRRSTVR